VYGDSVPIDTIHLKYYLMVNVCDGLELLFNYGLVTDCVRILGEMTRSEG